MAQNLQATLEHSCSPSTSSPRVLVHQVRVLLGPGVADFEASSRERKWRLVPECDWDSAYEAACALGFDDVPNMWSELEPLLDEAAGFVRETKP